jgi:two-component system response regulator AtoC
MFGLMDRVRKHDFPVVIRGESGTGKELVARAIHFTGSRKRGPFVALNCGAVPENLLESELFGHVKGAFTGAIAERRGVFESASHGTLLLDEVGEMPLAMQVKLLRVLQTGEITRVGSTRTRQVDVRVLAATHRDLEALTRDGSFREDLLYRLRVVDMTVPPLRERVSDIPILVRHFLERNLESGLGQVERVTPRALSLMARYGWPGNVRELETFLKSACVFAEGSELDLVDIVPLLERAGGVEAAKGSTGEARGQASAGMLTVGRLADVERQVIEARLAHFDGNKRQTAASLGIDRGTLYNKIRAYGLVT